MTALSEKEKKQILRYCVYPKIALLALVMSFVLCALIVPLEMIDDLVFHNDGFEPVGLNVGIALIALCVVVFCFCALRPKFGMRGKQWIDLQNRLSVRQTQSDRSAQVAGVLATQAAGRLLQNSDNKAAQAHGGAAQVARAIGAVGTAADMLSESANNAEAMAKAYGVPIPNIKKKLVACAIVPVLVLIAVYVPQYAQGNQETQEKIALAAEQVDIAANALAPVCQRVSADDPYERYKDYGYHVRGYLREGDFSWDGAYVYLTFDEYGTMTEIYYCEGVDVTASLEENLSQAEQDFRALNAPLSGLGVSVADPELLATCAIPAEFEEAFLQGSFYEDIRVYDNDAPVRVACSFDTESEEQFDEYSRPQIALSLRKANA
ncbi:hypothetical protein [uncultured Senegalimassilia sp.]|uniref:hypothetical protein n=1 Tax=uncultured Senegalimassilia sp. TaxID=1714350 RepID=UPI0025CDFC5D|nr:hypothetical protein [uncultured Senegalimassilia sp.]